MPPGSRSSFSCSDFEDKDKKAIVNANWIPARASLGRNDGGVNSPRPPHSRERTSPRRMLGRGENVDDLNSCV